MLSGAIVNSHFAERREFLGKSGSRWFPTFVLERHNTLERLDHTPFLGRPEVWQSALRSMAVSTPSPALSMKTGCGPNGCAL